MLVGLFLAQRLIRSPDHISIYDPPLISSHLLPVLPFHLAVVTPHQHQTPNSHIINITIGSRRGRRPKHGGPCREAGHEGWCRCGERHQRPSSSRHSGGRQPIEIYPFESHYLVYHPGTLTYPLTAKPPGPGFHGAQVVITAPSHTCLARPVHARLAIWKLLSADGSIQATIVIVFCQLLHYPLRLINQPRVIAEVIGGIILGPSVMMRIPGFQQGASSTWSS